MKKQLKTKKKQLQITTANSKKLLINTFIKTLFRYDTLALYDYIKSGTLRTFIDYSFYEYQVF